MTGPPPTTYARGSPSWLQKLAFILKFYIFRCGHYPWYVYLATGGKALERVVMVLMFIDMGDMVRSFFRPKGPRTSRHGPGRSRRNKRKGSAAAIPEPSDLIAKGLDPDGALKSPKWSNAGRFVWEIDTALQHQLNHIVFFNLALNFAYDWFSGIITNRQANCDIGRVRGERATSTVNAGGWSGVPNLTKTDQVSPMDMVNNIVTCLSGTWTVFCVMKVKNIGISPTPGEYQIGWFTTGSDATAIDVSDTQTLLIGQEGDLICECTVVGGGEVQLLARTEHNPGLYHTQRIVGFQLKE